MTISAIPEIKTIKFVSSSSPYFFSQAYEFESDEGRNKTKGSLYVCITAFLKEQTSEINPIVAGREIASTIRNNYIQSTKTSANLALKDATLSGSVLYKNTLDIEVAAASFIDGSIYITSYGGGRVLVFRNKMFASLLESGGGVIGASGKSLKGDIMILCSSGFLNNKIREAINKHTASLPNETFVNEVQGLLREGNVDKYCALFLVFGKDPETDGIHNAKFDSDSANKKIFKATNIRTLLKMPLNVFRQRIQKSPFSGRSEERVHVPTLKTLMMKAGVFLNFIFRKKKIYLSEGIENLEDTGRRKKNTVVGIFALSLLVCAIISGLIVKNVRDKNSAFENKVLLIRHLLDEAVDIYSLNPIRSQALLRDSKLNLSSFTEEEKESQDYKELYEMIEENIGKILGEYEMETSLFLDLSLIEDDFLVFKTAYSNKTIIVLDKSSRRLVSIDAESKRTSTVLRQDPVLQSESITSGGGQIYLLATDGVYEILKNKANKVIETNFSEGTQVKHFTGNLYTLESKSAVIRKFSKADEGFLSGVNWLKDGIDRELLDGVDFEVDGSIWVLLQDGRIIRYLSGAKERVSFSGIEPGLNKITDIYSTQDTEYVYVLDREHDRIVVLSKSGEYKAQYSGDLVNSVKEIIADENLKKLFMFTDSKIYVNELN